MDLRMPGMDGAEATRQIRATLRETEVLVLTTYADDESLFPALEAGARGYLTKDASAEEIEQAIGALAAGRTHLDPAVQQRLGAAVLDSPPAARADGDALPDDLTPCEAEVLKLIAAGLSNTEIAAALVVSNATARRTSTTSSPRQAHGTAPRPSATRIGTGWRDLCAVEGRGSPRSRASAGDSGERLGLRPIVLHRHDPSVAEAHHGCCLGGPFRAADLTRMGHDDDRVAIDGTELERSCGKPLSVTFTEGPQDVLAALAIPLAGLEPVPPDGGVEKPFDGVEIAVAPGCEPFLGDFQRLTAHGRKPYAT